MSASSESPRSATAGSRSPSGTDDGSGAARADASTSAPGPEVTATSGWPGAFGVALALAALGAVLAGLAPLLGVVTPAAAPAFLSWPFLLVLAAVAPAVAWTFARRGLRTAAAAVLLGPAALAPGRLVLDGQLLVDAGLAARPELLLTSSLTPLSVSIGTWLLLVGHLATGAAGVLALVGVERTTEVRTSFGSAEAAGAPRQGLLALVLLVTVVAAVGLLMAPFASDDAYLLPRSAVDAPVAVLVGSLLLAIAVPVVGGFAASAADSDVARGGLLGLAAALGAVSLPPLLAAILLSSVRFGWGSVIGLLAAVVLTGLAWSTGRPAATGAEAAELRLPALERLLRLASMAGVLAGVLAFVAALLPQLDMPAGMAESSPYPARLLLPAGALLAVLSVGVALPRTGLWLRPALVVATAVVPLASAAALDTVFTALSAAGARAGAGAWAAGGALVLAGVTAVLAALAGGVERDDVDVTEVEVRRSAMVPVVPAALLAIATFVFPVVTAPDYTPPGVFTDFGTTSWGLVAALTAVLAALALATVSRPARSAALLCGAALVVLVHVLELPLTAGRAAGSAPGLGLWCGVACLAVLLVGVAVTARSPQAAE